jgi:5-methylcytosine-specific restriction endonuclease McrA
MVPCDVCGQPTRSQYKVCRRTLACEQERRYRRGVVPRPRRCEMCGGPLRADSQNPFCLRNLECRNAHDRARRPDRRAFVDCEVCGKPTTSQLRVCGRTLACNRERVRRQRLADIPAARKKAAAKQRAYKRRPDRACRYARSRGCTEYALPGQSTCGVHYAEDARRYQARRRARLNRKLAARQNWLCPWCGGGLPADLADTHQDHVWPLARGGPDEDWNLQLVHGRCNHIKGDRLTAEAIALAAQHGWRPELDGRAS